ncbi:hypothetical protein AW736_07155 [Termitidicoccus mucosus]|uniref:Uncharacterized protein n=1 Tax=Termitidicoccus mucosus TaxID=1184151 RepID=A0A178IL06_9BACT|nr:hypothetical protein AW736_07155 [Opitutaceae bacterium TSB47]
MELLLVIVILSAVAWMLTSTVGDNIAQVRYDDTRNRLDAIRGAVLGPTGAAALERGILSGYVVDNGVLPENIKALVTRIVDDSVEPAVAHDAFGLTAPVFNQGSAGEAKLEQPEHLLMKGHRGAYVAALANGWFRDGWGTELGSDGTAGIDCPTLPDGGSGNEGNNVDADNHGWCVTRSQDRWYVDSYGLDGKEGQLTGTPYEQDMPMSPPILADDWQVNVQGRSVRIYNKTGAILELGGVNLSAALLVYKNDANGDGPNWESVRTAAVLVNSLGNSDYFEAPFPNTGRVPIPTGEHLLVLVHEPGGGHSDTPDLAALVATEEWKGTQQYITKRVKFYSRGGVPDMVLEIR